MLLANKSSCIARRVWFFSSLFLITSVASSFAQDARPANGVGPKVEAVSSDALAVKSSGEKTSPLVLGQSDIRVMLQDLMKTDPGITSSKKAMEAAGSDSNASFLSFFPSQSLTGDRGREFIDSQSKRDAGSDGANQIREKLSFTLTQPVFAGGAIRSGYQTAKIQEEISRISVQVAEGAALNNGLARYFQLIKNYKLYNYAVKKEQTIKDKLELETVRVERGSALAIEELAAKGSLLAATTQRVTLQGDYLSALAQFKSVFGDSPVMKDLLKSEIKISNVTTDIEEAVGLAMSNNSNISLSSLNIDIAEKSKSLVSAGFWPNVDLEGKVNWEKDAGGELGIRRDWTVLLKLTWNAQLSSIPALRSARHSLHARQSDLVAAKRAVSEGVEGSIILLKSLQQVISLASNGVTIAQELYNAQKKQLDEGEITEVDLLGAYVGVFDAQSAYVGAKYDRNILKVSILNSLGILSMDSIVDDALGKK
jgi:outer membrane protein TolC